MRMVLCRLNGNSIGAAIECLSNAGLSEAECSRLRGIRNMKGCAASVGARLALLWALTDANGVLPVYNFDDLPFVKDKPLAALCHTEAGAPYLAGSNLAVSFAHSDQLAVCVVTEAGRIGVDIEPLDRRISRADDIAARCFSEDERAQLEAAVDRDDAFLRIWTRKEALGKALGTGLNNETELLDTAAYSDDCFFEQTVEGSFVSTFVLR